MSERTPATGSSRPAVVPVSVVVPAFNAAATLPRALASIYAQSQQPAEIIVVDDASTDNTADVIAALIAEDREPPIRSLRLVHNSGPASARNAGWQIARQDFIAFLDADDAWHPRKLEIQHGWLSCHADVALCGHRCVVAGGEGPLVEVVARATSVRRLGLAKFLISNRISTPTVMLRRDVSQRFAGGKRHSEDYLLWMQIVASRGAAAYIDLPLTTLFKARYGASGLSADLWRMRVGEIDTFIRLRQLRIIGRAMWLVVWAWAWAKFIKRFVAQVFRGLSNRSATGA
jgi:glycosyltransferase involved in cell wall biosynthesis